MGKKLIATVLVTFFTMSLVSCSLPADPNSTLETHSRENRIEFEKNIVETVGRITDALAECDYEDLLEYCSETPELIGDAMPVAPESADGSLSNTDKKKMVENMIAGTITSRVEKETFKTEFWSEECTIDVTFSYKDYNQVTLQRDVFLNPGDFNSRLLDVTDTIDQVFTLKFKKVGNKVLLANADSLVPLYDYKNTDLNYMRSFFDMVERIYMTGEGWDQYTDSYTNTDTFEIVLVLSPNASDYIWEYVYRVSNETSPNWTHLYTSGKIVDKYPSEIRITYTADHIIEEGFYCILFYNYYDDTIIGYEFDVFNTLTSETENTSETSETTEG